MKRQMVAASEMRHEQRSQAVKASGAPANGWRFVRVSRREVAIALCAVHAVRRIPPPSDFCQPTHQRLFCRVQVSGAEQRLQPRDKLRREVTEVGDLPALQCCNDGQKQPAGGTRRPQRSEATLSSRVEERIHALHSAELLNAAQRRADATCKRGAGTSPASWRHQVEMRAAFDDRR